MGYTGNKKYSLEEIKEAVLKSKSFRQVAIRLGNTNIRAKESLRLRIHEANIDTSHFDGGYIVYTKEILAPIVKSCTSFGEVARFLQKPQTSRRHIANKIKDFGIDTSHFKQTRVPPGCRKAPIDYMYKQERSAPKIKSSSLRKATIALGVVYECQLCGLPPHWQGKTLILQIDHINGNTYDHQFENLRFLCPNCHCQTETWGYNASKSK